MINEMRNKLIICVVIIFVVFLLIILGGDYFRKHTITSNEKGTVTLTMVEKSMIPVLNNVYVNDKYPLELHVDKLTGCCYYINTRRITPVYMPNGEVATLDKLISELDAIYGRENINPESLKYI